MEILEPWKMVPLDLVDDAIALIEHKLQASHPLRQHALFPWLKRDDAPIWMLTKKEDDGTTWLLDFTRKAWINGRTCYFFRKLANDDEAEAMIQMDHQQWLQQCPDDAELPGGTDWKTHPGQPE